MIDRVRKEESSRIKITLLVKKKLQEENITEGRRD